jgi:hypothetical protein
MKDIYKNIVSALAFSAFACSAPDPNKNINGGRPYSAVGDFNGDGIKDLVFGDKTGRMFIRPGTPEYLAGPIRRFKGRIPEDALIETLEADQSAGVVDLNQDGIEDFIHIHKDKIYIRMSKDDGSFEDW